MPSVTGVVRDPANRLLLVKQRDSGVWSTPGGSIELDETPAESVVREVWEETGLVVTPRRVFAVYGGPNFVVRYPNGDEMQYISMMFECDVVSGTPHVNDDEIDEVAFWSHDEASGLTMSPWLVRVLPRLYERHDTPWFEAPRAGLVS